MNCASKFRDFIGNIVLTTTQRDNLKSSYKTLKSRLTSDPTISGHIVTMFLQGSYARQTGVKPVDDDKADVDLIIVTDFDHNIVTPSQALQAFRPFLEKNYERKWRYQGRSIGIELSECCLDIVPVALPSNNLKAVLREAYSSIKEDTRDMLKIADSYDAIISAANNDDSWKREPLKIPNRESNQWEDTHPLAQIEWSMQKNANTDSQYKRVVKALKWWKKKFVKNCDSVKSYPLEHFIGDNCPNLGASLSLAEYVVQTLGSMARYIFKPRLNDRGVPQHDVFGRVSESDFKVFIDTVKTTYAKAQMALAEKDNYESSVKWREIFGNEFPLYEKPSPQFTKREEPSLPTTPNRYA